MSCERLNYTAASPQEEQEMFGERIMLCVLTPDGTRFAESLDLFFHSLCGLLLFLQACRGCQIKEENECVAPKLSLLVP